MSEKLQPCRPAFPDAKGLSRQEGVETEPTFQGPFHPEDPHRRSLGVLVLS